MIIADLPVSCRLFLYHYVDEYNSEFWPHLKSARISRASLLPPPHEDGAFFPCCTNKQLNNASPSGTHVFIYVHLFVQACECVCVSAPVNVYEHVCVCVGLCLSSLCNETPEVSEGHSGVVEERTGAGIGGVSALLCACANCRAAFQTLALGGNLQQARRKNSALFTRERGGVSRGGWRGSSTCSPYVPMKLKRWLGGWRERKRREKGEGTCAPWAV